MADEQGFLKVRIPTALILAGIIFTANLIAGFITQNKDVSIVQAEQKALHQMVDSHETRISVTENFIKDLKNDMCEVKKDLKDMSKSQSEFMREMARAHKGVKP